MMERGLVVYRCIPVETTPFVLCAFHIPHGVVQRMCLKVESVNVSENPNNPKHQIVNRGLNPLMLHLLDLHHYDHFHSISVQLDHHSVDWCHARYHSVKHENE